MSKDSYALDIPFVRLFKRPKANVADSKLANRNIYPEIIFIAAAVLSASTWKDGVIALVVWCITLFLLITLASTNTRTQLLPDKLTRVLAGLAVLFAVVLSVHLSSTWPLISAVLGAALVGGVPYVLFQISAGRWIGGGDVKLGLAAGLLLGWKYGVLCIGLMIVLTLLSFVIEYMSGKLAKSSHVTRIGTGTLWAIAVTACVLVSQ